MEKLILVFHFLFILILVLQVGIVDAEIELKKQPVVKFLPGVGQYFNFISASVT